MLRQQIITPVQRRAQRLVPRQRRAPPLPEQLEAVVQQRQGFLNPVGIGAAGGEFDRKGYSIQPAADFSDDGRIGIVQFKAAAAGDRALDEELHRREIQRLRRGETGVIGRTPQRGQPMNMFAFDTQRFPAGRQNVHLRCLLENAFRQRRRGLDHVLAAIEDQQHPFAAEETYQTAGWIRGLNRQPERRGHRARNEKRIVERSKIKKLNGTGKLGKQLITYRDRDGGLADATRSHDGDEALGLQLLRYFLNGLVAPHHSCQAGRKIVGLTGLRGHRLQGSWRTRTRDRRHETIALPRKSRQIRGSDSPSPSALRRAATWTRRLPSSTVTPGQTRAIRSFLLTTSPACSTRTMKISSARPPR